MAKKRIEDYGEKIGGARKDHYGSLSPDNLTELNEIEKNELANKPNVWPRPDYEKMLNENGVERDCALAIKVIYDAIARTPYRTRYQDPQEAIEIFVEAVHNIREIEKAKTLDQLRETIEGIKPTASGKEFTANITPRNRTSNSIIGGLFDRKQWREGQTLPFNAQRNMDKVLRKNPDWPHSRQMWQIMADKRGLVTKLFSRPEGEPAWSIGRKYSSAPTGVYDAEKDDYVTRFFETKEEADTFLRKKIEDSIARSDESKYRKPVLKAAQWHREGPPTARGEKDVTEQMFAETFHLRGVEFGNWTDQKHRQKSINHAYDALCDLAELMGMPNEAIGLDGTLSMAFGSRGRGGKAAAHYEPARKVINLTKTQGAGSLAHEWFHALDHYLAGQSTDKTHGLFLTENSFPNKNQKRIQSTLINTPDKRAEDSLSRSLMQVAFAPQLKSQTLSKIHSDWHNHLTMAAHFLEAAVRKAPEYAKANPVLEQTAGVVSSILDQSGKSIRQYAPPPELENLSPPGDAAFSFDMATEKLQAMQESYDAFREVNQSPDVPPEHKIYRQSRFANAAKKIDKHRSGKPYYGTECEMGARSFEAWVNDTLQRRGRTNTYLAHYTTDNHYGNSGLYPSGGERLRINAALDHFTEQAGQIVTQKAGLPLPRKASYTLTPSEFAEKLLKTGTAKDRANALASRSLPNNRVQDIIEEHTRTQKNEKWAIEGLRRRMGVDSLGIPEKTAQAILDSPYADTLAPTLVSADVPPEFWAERLREPENGYLAVLLLENTAEGDLNPEVHRAINENHPELRLQSLARSETSTEAREGYVQSLNPVDLDDIGERQDGDLLMEVLLNAARDQNPSPEFLRDLLYLTFGHDSMCAYEKSDFIHVARSVLENPASDKNQILPYLMGAKSADYVTLALNDPHMPEKNIVQATKHDNPIIASAAQRVCLHRGIEIPEEQQQATP
jgi:hypothetical protein